MCETVYFSILDFKVYLTTLHIDSRERTHRAVMLAGSAAYTTLLVDGDAAVTGAFVAYDADGGGWAMARTGVACDPLA